MRSFVVVVDSGGFSAAARELDIVTSAVSRQVADLERHYDCQLLYRTTRSMHLTADGVFYLERFRELLASISDLETATRHRQQTVSGHRRITLPMNAYQLGLQNTLASFAREYPQVRLSLLLLNRYVNLVEEGIDLALRVGELDDSALIARRFGSLQVLFVASPDYLADNGRPDHPKDLVQHSCLVDSSTDNAGRWRYHDNGRERSVSVSGRIDANAASLVAELAAAGEGIAYLPAFLVQSQIESGKLEPILEPYQLPALPISLVYPGQRGMNPALDQLVQYLLDHRPAGETAAAR